MISNAHTAADWSWAPRPRREPTVPPGKSETQETGVSIGLWNQPARPGIRECSWPGPIPRHVSRVWAVLSAACLGIEVTPNGATCRSTSCILPKTSTAGAPYDNMLEILVSQELRPGPSAFGAGRGLEALGDSQRCVCFSEIPLDLLGRLVARRSVYGVGFMDALLVLNGGARV